MNYLRTFQYIFEHPKWATNVLLAALCFLIPVVGPIVLLGYQFEIVEALHRSPADLYPAFDFSRFMDYLKRGVWPFLVSMVAGLLAVPLVFVLVFGGAFLMVFVGTQASLPLTVASTLMGALLIFLMVLALNFLMQPLFLRAGLIQDFGKAFNLPFIRHFCALLWKEIFVFWLFMAFAGFFLAILGMMLCFIGIYLTMAVLMMAQAHGYSQLYDLYLSRGGTPIPLSSEKA